MSKRRFKKQQLKPEIVDQHLQYADKILLKK